VGIKEFIVLFEDLKVCNHQEWIAYCESLKNELHDFDICETVDILRDILIKLPTDTVIVSDVGNNEFWVSQAYVLSGIKNRIVYSKAFGALGNAVAKGIGAYYQSDKPVVCFIGDQGFQFNIQELQLIAQEKLPITVCVINNSASGMIRDRQVLKYDGACCGTTPDTGFGCPDIKSIAGAYGFDYSETYKCSNKPLIVELKIKEDIALKPNLPIGNNLKNMLPTLPDRIFKQLDIGVNKD